MYYSQLTTHRSQKRRSCSEPWREWHNRRSL